MVGDPLFSIIETEKPLRISASLPKKNRLQVGRAETAIKK